MQVKLYYELVVSGQIRYSQVPKKYRHDVGELLIKNGHRELLKD